MADAFLETLWPTRCAICDTMGAVICPSCLGALPFTDVNRACPSCGAPYGQHQCTECNDAMLQAAQRDCLPLDGMAHVLMADDAARRIVTVYKDANERRLAAVISQLCARYVPPEWARVPLTYIPATKEALRRRGFDHMADVTHALGQHCGVPVLDLFERPVSLDKRKFDRHGRQRNMEGRFCLHPEVRVPQEVLLVDDVCTTGATLFAAADCLRAGGAKRIYGLTFAKVLAT